MTGYYNENQMLIGLLLQNQQSIKKNIPQIHQIT